MKKKLMIVDDEEHILHILSRALRHPTLEIITATHIEDAEYAIKNTHLDLVLADIRLTGVLGREGLELLDYVREKSPGTQVIIMTGYGSEEMQRESYERGAAYYFEKPIDLNALKDQLRKMGYLDDGQRVANES